MQLVLSEAKAIRGSITAMVGIGTAAALQEWTMTPPLDTAIYSLMAYVAAEVALTPFFAMLNSERHQDVKTSSGL